MFTSRPALRWLVPVAALAVVAGVTGTVLRADAAGALPPRSAKQLLVDLQTARPGSFSGTVVQQARLGLPELPALSTGEGSSDLSSLVSGNHTLKVWYDGPQRVRLALLGTLGESDIIRNGRDVWTWSSTEKSAQHRVLPEQSTEPEGAAIPDADQLPKTPQEAADQALAALDPSTKVTTDGTARVAGLDAYQLVLSPRDEQSLVGQVRLAIDAKSHLPLQVQVYARGVSEPAFQVGFTKISFGKPSADHFTFTPPPGTKVEQVKPEKQEPEQADKSKPEAAADRSEPSFVGKGWTTVVVARTAEPGKPAQESGAPGDSGELGAVVQSLPKVSGDWGSGRLLKGSLFTVLFTDDGRVLAGAVAPDRLYSVARTTR